MHKFFLAIVISALALQACNSNDDTTDSILTQPPYNKLTDSIKLAPNNAELYYHRGSLLYNNNQILTAEKDLRKAWEINPKEEYALSVVTVLKQRNVDSAILFLQKALQKLPNSVALQIGLARGFQQKNQLDKALNICNTIIQKYPNQIDALILKSELLEAMNKNDEALQALETAYSYAPDDVELVHKLCFEYANNKNSKTLKLADSLLKADTQKTHAEPNYFKGLYYENIGNYDEALKNFDAAISRDYYFIDAYMDKTQTLYDEKKYSDALKTLQLATTVSPTYAPAYYWLGKVQEAMNDKTNAKLNYQRAYGLDTTLKQAKQAADRL